MAEQSGLPRSDDVEEDYPGISPNVNTEVGIFPSSAVATVDPRDRFLWRVDGRTVDLREPQAAAGPSLGGFGLALPDPCPLTDDGPHDAGLGGWTQAAPECQERDLVGLIYLAINIWFGAGAFWLQ